MIPKLLPKFCEYFIGVGSLAFESKGTFVTLFRHKYRPISAFPVSCLRIITRIACGQFVFLIVHTLCKLDHRTRINTSVSANAIEGAIEVVQPSCAGITANYREMLRRRLIKYSKNNNTNNNSQEWHVEETIPLVRVQTKGNFFFLFCFILQYQNQ